MLMSVQDTPRILVVDDNQDNANIVRQYLEVVWGYSISVAYDGDEALRMFEIERPTIVLLDVMMPGRDGWEVCRLIKAQAALHEAPHGTTHGATHGASALPASSQVRVIMVTALDDISDKCQALQTGADDFIEKPFDLAKLAATVRRNLAALAHSNAA
jgi:DNA-binding response OmpR family regulator